MKIIIVRHGETEWNKEEIFRGGKNIPLNKNGLKQVKLLSKKLSDLKINRIFSSPLKRASQTSEEIAKFHNLNVEMENSLIDINFGRWEGMTLKEVKRKFPEKYKIWVNNPENLKFPEGENLKNVRERVENFLQEKVFNLKEDSCIAVVSHRVINKIIILSLLGIPNKYFWNIKQDVATFTLFEKTRFGWIMNKHNEGCHLGKIKLLKDF